MSIALLPFPRAVPGILRITGRCNSASALRRVCVAAGSRPASLDELLVSPETVKSSQELDAIVVLGGGLWESKVIPPWAERRLDGAALLRAESVTHPSILICGGGSPHGLPVLDESTGQVVHEGTAYAEYLMETWNVPSSCILKESSSYDTVGNGYEALSVACFVRIHG